MRCHGIQGWIGGQIVRVWESLLKGDGSALRQQGIEPRQVSFAGAVQTINAFAPVLHLAQRSDLPRLWEILLRAIARHRVGNRPDRVEPRAVKRRAKPIAWLTEPRQQARTRLLDAARSRFNA
jgi:hypothetical protein